MTAGGGTPTGTVTFLDGSTTLGTGSLSSSGQATFITSSTAPWPWAAQTITATYGGDASFTASNGSIVQTVTAAPTSLQLAASAVPTAYGQLVLFTATVSATAPGSATPTGAVTFMDGTTKLGTVTLVNGQAAYTTSVTAPLPMGPQMITASYAAGTDFGGSSAAMVETVTPTATTTTVSASTSGQQATVTVTVSAVSGSAIPTGTLTFTSGTTTLGSAHAEWRAGHLQQHDPGSGRPCVYGLLRRQPFVQRQHAPAALVLHSRPM